MVELTVKAAPTPCLCTQDFVHSQCVFSLWGLAVKDSAPLAHHALKYIYIPSLGTFIQILFIQGLLADVLFRYLC